MIKCMAGGSSAKCFNRNRYHVLLANERPTCIDNGDDTKRLFATVIVQAKINVGVKSGDCRVVSPQSKTPCLQTPGSRQRRQQEKQQHNECKIAAERTRLSLQPPDCSYYEVPLENYRRCLDNADGEM